MHVLEAALVAHLVNSPRRLFADRLPACEHAVQPAADTAIADPARPAADVRSGLVVRISRLLPTGVLRNRVAARNVA